MTLDEALHATGEEVRYLSRDDAEPDFGIIKRCNELYAFVIYSHSDTPMATLPERLTLMRWIKAAAVRDTDGKVWSLPRPARHNDVLRKLRAEGAQTDELDPDMQGFLTGSGAFTRRTPAYVIATKAGQILGGQIQTPQLSTDDLW